MEKKLPAGWVRLKIGELTDIVSGGTPSTSVKENFDGDIAWITPADLSGYGKKYISSGRKYLTALGLKNSSARLIPKESVLFSSRAPIGYVAIAANELCTNQGFKSLIPNEVYDSSFAYYYLKSIKNLAETEASGTTFKELSGSKMAMLPFPLPPLAEQKRIVAKLDMAFGYLETLKASLARIPELLKTFRQSVLTQAVTGKLTEDWRVGKELDAREDISLIENFLIKNKKYKKIETHNISSISNSWQSTKIANIGIISNGSTPSRAKPEYWNGSIPWIGSSLVQNNRIKESTEKITDEGFKNSSTKILAKGTVLIAMIGEGKTRAQSAILDVAATINQNIAAVEIDHGKIIPEFLQYFFIANYQKHRIAGNGTGPQALNCQRVREFDFDLPPHLEQQEIVIQVESLFAKADAIEAQYLSLKEKINKLPQALLAKAFRGELVPQDPADEPASVLLEKIQNEIGKLGKKGKKQMELVFED